MKFLVVATVSLCFSSPTITKIHLAKKWNIVFESVDFLYMTNQILVPALLVITSKHDKLVVLLSILNFKFGLTTWFQIVCKSLGLIKLMFKRTSPPSKNQNKLSLKYFVNTKF